MKAILTVSVCLLSLALVLIIVKTGVTNRSKQTTDSASDLLESVSADVYVATTALYRFDTEKRTWVRVLGDMTGLFPQNVDMNAGLVISNSLRGAGCRLYSAANDNVCELGELGESASTFAISNSGRYVACLAYHTDGNTRSLIVFDTGSKRVTAEYPEITELNSLSWSHDETHLYYSDGTTIYSINNGTSGVSEICRGYWVKGLTHDSIGYWVNETGESVCYMRNMATQDVVEVCRTRKHLLGANWDTEGRFVIAMASASLPGFFSRYDCFPIFWDTVTGRSYILPGSSISGRPFKTGNVFWIASNGGGRK